VPPDAPPTAWTPPTNPATWGAPVPAPLPQAPGPQAPLPQGWGAPAPTSAPAAAGGASVAELEACCAALKADVEHLAVFAKTLLLLLEERGIVTEEQFQAAHRKVEAAPPGS
jgi:hypothetical protein